MRAHRLAPAVLGSLLLVVAALWLASDPRGEPPVPAGRVSDGAPTPGGAVATSDLALPEQARPDDRDVAIDDGALPGRVVLPPGTPDDEVLVVAAHGVRDVAPAAPPTRAPVAEDGTFRLALPEDEVRLQLEASYLYLAEPLRVRRADVDGELVLEPRLGGALEVELRPPADASADDVERVDVSLVGSDPPRIARPSGDLTARFGGLRPDERYVLVADAGVFAPVRETGLSVRAGERSRLVVTFQRGAEIRGVVVAGPGGPGVADASVVARHPGSPPLPPRADRTAADGSFRLRGIPAGEVTLAVEAHGWLGAAHGPRVLGDGAVVEGLEIVLASGSGVAGRVLWPDGTPAAGARVRASLEASGPSTDWRVWSRLEAAPDTLADADGRFAVTGLVPGRYTITAALERGADATAPGAAPWTARREDVGVDADDLELVLEASCSIVGRVVDDRGAPVESFRVEATREERSSFTRVRPGAERQHAGGRFEHGGLERGTWSVTARAEGHLESETVDVELPGAPEIELVLVRAATLRGAVLAPDGSPCEDAQVVATGGADGISISQAIGADGRFELSGVPPGTVSLAASSERFASSAAEVLELVPGQELDDLTLVLGAGGRLTGEVYGPLGGPAAGAVVSVQSAAGDGRQVTADGAGRFELDGLTPGAYRVFAVPGSWLEDGPDPQGPESPEELFDSLRLASATVVAGETVHVVLGAPPSDPVRVTGRVLRGGEPVAEAIVVALRSGRPILESMRMRPTDASGRFELVLDEPGEVTLVVTGDEPRVRADFDVDVPAVEHHAVELQLPGGAIRGTVRGPDGRPVGSLPVQVEREDASALAALFHLFDDSGDTWTDGDGRYEVEGLRAGTYTVSVGGVAFGSSAPLGRAQRAGLVLGTDRVLDGIDFRLAEAGTVAGTVHDASGRPVAGARIGVRDEAGRLLDGDVVTDPTGRFEESHVAPGQVTVLAVGAGPGAAESEPVRVAAGETTTVELVLRPGTLLVVACADAQGEPRAARFSVVDAEGRAAGGLSSQASLERLLLEGVSSSERRFGPLPPGDYVVRAIAPDGAEASAAVQLGGEPERRVELRPE